MEDNEILAARRKRLVPEQPTASQILARTIADIGTSILFAGCCGLIIFMVLK